jgi:hypothetical protein
LKKQHFLVQEDIALWQTGCIKNKYRTSSDEFCFLKGTVVKEEASQSIKSKITVKNMANGEIVGYISSRRKW